MTPTYRLLTRAAWIWGAIMIVGFLLLCAALNITPWQAISQAIEVLKGL